MKFCFILLFAACMQVSATGNAQGISLQEKNAALEKVLEKIKKQSGYGLFLDEKLLAKAVPVTVSIQNSTLEEALTATFKNQPLLFEIIGKTITIKDKPATLLKTEIVAVPPLDVKGRITNEAGEPVVGPNIPVKGTNRVTTTNSNGEFELKDVIESAVLVITFVGYEREEITLNGNSNLTVKLKMKMDELSNVQVVSTGYQNLPKERATGSFSSVNKEVYDQRVSTNLLSRLEGITSGLVFNRSSTSAPTINIRGQSTIYGNNRPLIVVDGFPIDGDLDKINPNDIADITILKDAAAASIWGVRAGNGVVVITTKKGKYNTPFRVDVSSNLTVGEKPDLSYIPSISSGAFIDMERYLFANNIYSSDETNTVNRPALSPVVELLIAERDGAITSAEAQAQIDAFRQQDVRRDFERYLLRNAINQQYTVKAYGGSDRVRYLLSTGYDRNRESFTGDDFSRVIIRSENTFKVLDRLEVMAGLQFTADKRGNNSPGLSLLTSSSSRKGLYPYASLADAAGNSLPVNWLYRTPFIENAATAGGLSDWRYYPLDEVGEVNKTLANNYLRLNSGLKYQLLEGLDAELRYQYERNAREADNLYDANSYYTRNLVNRFTQVNTNGSLSFPVPQGAINGIGTSALNAHTVRGQLSFDRRSERDQLNMIAGFEIKESKLRDNGMYYLYGYNPDVLTSRPIDYTGFYRQYYSSSLTSQIPGGTPLLTDLTDRFRSYYSNAAYTIKDKYTVSASARLDASNLFGVAANKRKVPLWSAGLLWNLTRESFMKIPGLDRLILRGTYGYNGNVDKSVTAYTTTQRTTEFLTGQSKATIINPPNPDLRWERTGIFNLGADFSILEDLLSGSVEWYRKNGKDLLGFQTLEPTTGVLTYKGNVASMKGSGLDVQLRFQPIRNKLKWTTTALFSYAKDRITKMSLNNLTSVTVIQQSASFSGNNVDIVPVEGNAVYGLYSYRFAGLDPQTGDPLGIVDGQTSNNYATIRSTPVGELVYSGPARPVYFGGLNTSLQWQRFSFSFNFSFKAGYSFRKSTIDFATVSRNWNGHSDYLLRWQQPGDEQRTNVPSMPLVVNQVRNDFYSYSDALIRDASHIRFQDAYLGYDLPPLKSVRSVRLFLYANNLLLLWTANKENIDPDFNPEPNSIYLPSPRTISFGIQASL